MTLSPPPPGFEVTPRSNSAADFVKLRREDLLTNVKALKDEDSHLEVRLKNFLLEAGLQIVSASVAPGNMDAFVQTLKYLKNELHPFVIYALDGRGPLTEEVCPVGGSMHLCDMYVRSSLFWLQ